MGGGAFAAPRWWPFLVVAAATIAVAGALILTTSRTDPAAEPHDPGRPATTAARDTGAPAHRICGFTDASSISSAPNDVDPQALLEPAAQNLPDHDELRFQTFAVGADTIAALHSNYKPEAMVSLYSLSGDMREQFTVDLGPGRGHEIFLAESLAIDPDGAVYLIDANGGDNAIIKFTPDGDEAWATDVGHLDRGRASSVFAWHDQAGDPVIGVTFLQGPPVLIGPHGDVRSTAPGIDGDGFFPQPDGTMAAVTVDNAGGAHVYRFGADLEPDGHFGSSGALAGHSRTGGPTMLGSVSGVAATPDGGLLIAAARRGITLVDESGLWRGVAADGALDFDAEFWFLERTPLVAYDDLYYFAIDDRQGGLNVVAADYQDLLELVHRPVKHNAGHGGWQAVLGYGAGLLTNQPLNYFAPDREPHVFAVFDPWWSQLADRFELRYEITADPRLDPEPLVTDVVALPDQGGQIELQVPPAEPGPYQVHAELVDAGTGEVHSSTCLNYSIGGPGSQLDFRALADGADWGGARPLRGVQLADQLGVGSHRWQLDFGRIVPDPAAEANPDALVWDSLPGGTEESPFTELAAAAELADRLDVKLVVQLGSGGDAELRAVAASTWGEWAGAIASVLRREVPQLRYWAPWNEPNIAGIGDGAEYVSSVLAPFAENVRAAHPDAVVLGGNSLGTVADWWEGAMAAGACDWLDVISIHPYTAYNRSWEEDGMAGPDGQLSEFKEVVAQCADLGRPIWNTESGWWADGPAAFWAQADDVARAYLWMRAEGIDEWTYFFSEGGFGETGNSWSLIQHADYVKPGALAFMTIDRLMDGRPAPEVVETGIPFSYAMRIGAPGGRGTSMLAAWTDEMVLDARLVTDSDTPVEVVVHDVYGGTDAVTISRGQAADVRLSGSPIFAEADNDATLAIEPVEPFGPDVLLSGEATASSEEDGFPAGAVLKGDARSTSLWLSGPERADGEPDIEPWLEVTLDSPTAIDRIVVATRSIRCCTAGLRNYTVSVHTGGEWRVVAEQRDQFFERTALFAFDPVEADAVRIDIPSTVESGIPVMSANYAGYAGGLHPAWWPLATQSDQIAAISAVAAFAPEP